MKNYMLFLSSLSLFTLYSAEPIFAIPDESFQNIILKQEGYPIEYHAALWVPLQKAESVRQLANHALAQRYSVYFTGRSVSITIPEDQGRCFTHLLHSHGIIPAWVKVIKR